MNIEPWVVDVMFASSLSLASNGAAALFPMFAGHALTRNAKEMVSVESKSEIATISPSNPVNDVEPRTITGSVPNVVQLPPPSTPKPKPQRQLEPTEAQLQHVATFLESVTVRDAGATMPLAAIPRAYLHWCKDNGHVPLDTAILGAAFSKLAARVAISVVAISVVAISVVAISVVAGNEGERIVHGLRLAA